MHERTTQVSILNQDDTLNSHGTISVTIRNDGIGERVYVYQALPAKDAEISLNREQWLVLRLAIDKMMDKCEP